MKKLLLNAAVCTFGLMLSTANAQDFSPYYASPDLGLRSSIPGQFPFTGQNGGNGLNGCFPGGNSQSICGPDGCYSPGMGSTLPFPQTNGTVGIPFNPNVNTYRPGSSSLNPDFFPMNNNRNWNQRQDRYPGSMMGQRPMRDRNNPAQDRFPRQQIDPGYRPNPGQYQIQPFPNPMWTNTPGTNLHLINHSVSPSHNGLTQY